MAVDKSVATSFPPRVIHCCFLGNKQPPSHPPMPLVPLDCTTSILGETFVYHVAQIDFTD